MNQDLSKILLLDNEPILVETAVEILNNKGFETHGFQCSKKLLSHLQQDSSNTFSCAILDIELSEDSSGFDVYKEIKKKIPNIPVIFISGFPPESSQEQFKQDTSVHFIKKPFCFDDLAVKIQSITN